MQTHDKENKPKTFHVPNELMKSQYLKQLSACQELPFGFTKVCFKTEEGRPAVKFEEIWFKNEIYSPVHFNSEERPLEPDLFNLLTQNSEIKADFRTAQYLCFNIETYA